MEKKRLEIYFVFKDERNKIFSYFSKDNSRLKYGLIIKFLFLVNESNGANKLDDVANCQQDRMIHDTWPHYVEESSLHSQVRR